MFGNHVVGNFNFLICPVVLFSLLDDVSYDDLHVIFILFLLVAQKTH